MAHFDQMLARRCQGEPLQYVVGRWAFRELDLLVDKRVLIPRPETEILVGHAITETNRLSAPTVLDLGTGTGAIALSVAFECPHSQVIAADISEDALAVARANLAGIGKAATRVTLLQGDWFNALDPSLPAEIDLGEIDLIVSNPPYIANHETLPDVVANHEPSLALRAGDDGTEHLRHIVTGSRSWLKPSGVVLLEMAPHQISQLSDHAQASGFSTEIHPDLAGHDRILICRL